ncbi:NAD-dependent epimerase/dehydratase family protein [Sulfitobacter sp. MF3-043]|uniref:NAD-dependent epimerase/dehydratase family protein n=1 Tax=Sulfitobacter sediminivivens TaxID=3252902 RepID=UPI003EB7CCC1
MLLGASGKLGQMLRQMWPVPDDLVCHSRYERPGFVSFDLCRDFDAVRKHFESARAVVCLSGVTARHARQSGDAFSLNTDLALAAVQAARDAGVGRVFLVSSAAVYGRAGGVLDESGRCDPLSDYGRAKLDMENAGLKKAADIGQQTTVLRIGNVAGADSILGGWTDDMAIDQLPDGRTPRRSYIGPDTLANVVCRLTQVVGLPDIMNVAAPGTVEMGRLLDAAGLPWVPRKAAVNVIENVELSTGRLGRHVRGGTQISTTAGLVAEWRRFTQNNRGHQNDFAQAYL